VIVEDAGNAQAAVSLSYVPFKYSWYLVHCPYYGPYSLHPPCIRFRPGLRVSSDDTFPL
jgi:hypothetical protein